MTPDFVAGKRPSRTRKWTLRVCFAVVTGYTVVAAITWASGHEVPTWSLTITASAAGGLLYDLIRPDTPEETR